MLRHCIPSARATRKLAAIAKAIPSAASNAAGFAGRRVRRRLRAGADNRPEGLLPGLRLQKRQRTAAPAVRLVVQLAQQSAAVFLVQFSVDQQVEPPIFVAVNGSLLFAFIILPQLRPTRSTPRAGAAERGATALDGRLWLIPKSSDNCR